MIEYCLWQQYCCPVVQSHSLGILADLLWFGSGVHDFRNNTLIFHHILLFLRRSAHHIICRIFISGTRSDYFIILIIFSFSFSILLVLWPELLLEFWLRSLLL